MSPTPIKCITAALLFFGALVLPQLSQALPPISINDKTKVDQIVKEGTSVLQPEEESKIIAHNILKTDLPILEKKLLELLYKYKKEFDLKNPDKTIALDQYLQDLDQPSVNPEFVDPQSQSQQIILLQYIELIRKLVVQVKHIQAQGYNEDFERYYRELLTLLAQLNIQDYRSLFQEMYGEGSESCE